jgi:TolB protein
MKKWFALLGAFVLGVAAVQAAEGDITVRVQVDGLGFPKAVPVHISGYDGEADRVLRFDLSFMGFEIVGDKSAATYLIQKNNAAGVGAQVTDLLQNKIPYNKAFSGGSIRQQTHALADDLAKALLNQPGIAQTRIALVAQPTGYGVGEIFVSDYDGFGASPVTRDGVIVHAPAWSGKGTLLYQSFKLGKGEILSHTVNTGARRQLARYPGLNASPAVSPDGRRVAMILSKSGSPDLWVADIDGGNLRQLTTTKEDESSPCWSPDGSQICVVSRLTGLPALYTIPAGGGQLTRLFTGSSPTEPDWSPDGKYIVFTTTSRSGFQINLLALDGPARGTVTPLGEGEDPVWASNSRAVLYVRSVNHRHVLALMDVPSKKSKDLIPISGSASEPAWAR